MKTVIVAYVPVLHAGYLHFLEKNPADAVVVLDPKSLTLPQYLKRDMRAVPAPVILKMVRALVGRNVRVGCRAILGTHEELLYLASKVSQVIMPREDVSLEVAKRYFQGNDVVFDDIFLRWNWENVEHQKLVEADRTLDQDSLDREFMRRAEVASGRSFDWWRQVGAVLVRDGKVLIEKYNRHMPSEQTHHIAGDPRIPFEPGVRTELSSAIHAERAIIAAAAREGISTAGTSLYVTTFPCPACAMSIAEAGIAKVYYTHGYSLVDAEGILRTYGVEIIHVRTTPAS